MAGVNRYFQRQIGAYNPVVRPLPFNEILQAGLLKQQGLDDARLAHDELGDEMILQGGRSTQELAQAKNNYFKAGMAEAFDMLNDSDQNPALAVNKMRKLNSEFNRDTGVQAIKQDHALIPIASKTETNQDFVLGNYESEHYDRDNNRWKQLTQEDIDSGVAIDASRYAPMYGTSLDKDWQPIIDQIKPDVMSESLKESGLKGGEYDIVNGRIHVYDEKKSSKYRELTRKKLAEKLGEYIYGDDTPLDSSDKPSVRFLSARKKRLKEAFGKDELFSEVMRIAQLGEFSEEYNTSAIQPFTYPAFDQAGSKPAETFFDGAYVTEIGAEDVNSKFAYHKINDVFSLSRAVSPEGIKEITDRVFAGS